MEIMGLVISSMFFSYFICEFFEIDTDDWGLVIFFPVFILITCIWYFIGQFFESGYAVLLIPGWFIFGYLYFRIKDFLKK